MDLETAVGDGPAQLHLQRAPRLGARVHAGFEEAIGAASVALGAVQGKVGILQQLVEIDAVVRRHRDADAGVGGDQMTGAFQRLPDRGMDRLDEARGFQLGSRLPSG